ncbi:MAG: hypothetical protein KZQ66_19390 [Candidatus Thiodiazotropha sp. (ex Lucinoma aequizonata)]|nr:hypothetical protein [Candidatus Thiodiazotropha sp. (ex Lucinoma aequizonata)]MCU7889556.1 hypothetical protein [Candidatus Thiodiazotropha sp. (ex Lucinoma aequizonata)]MCU7894665.1 hypothetical protein [Candidatus Thiodiazotropha sp. (ex Lucinoma aequizonata)]MCU7898523.1 hypothetical protein [Candidatus Thiodiazotropha sp. (ex Lucinoma aequizonata)]MCU7903873.1 hypothetical protein [Candidatus Thiodiazotropha sp. (ex Lucinoma aequizonata)]
MINLATGAAFVEEGVQIDRYITVAQDYLPDDPVQYRLPSLASGDILPVLRSSMAVSG